VLINHLHYWNFRDSGPNCTTAIPAENNISIYWAKAALQIAVFNDPSIIPPIAKKNPHGLKLF